MTRPPRLLHCTSEPLHFFGRADELALLDAALTDAGASIVALVGPGGQGKTAIVRHWLDTLECSDSSPLSSFSSLSPTTRDATPVASVSEGGLETERGEKEERKSLDESPHSRVQVSGVSVFFWSFYRGKDVDLCLREWLAYAERLDTLPEVSAAWCVERLLTTLRRERWAVVLDGAEVVQYEEGPWRGRFVHPDLARLLEELGSEAMPGVVVLTTRFELPTLARRPFVKLVSLDRLDDASAQGLLASLGVAASERDALAAFAGRHAKAVELVGTYRVRFPDQLINTRERADPADEETSVARVLALFQHALPREEQDILALATAFRDPPAEPLLLDYLRSSPIRDLLHRGWARTYVPFSEREATWLPARLEELIALRLLERVRSPGGTVIDAHPLVRRGFEHVAGPAGKRQVATARAGFLRGRPDRRRADTLEEAREAIELFHAHCDAGLWAEADGCLVALENPKHRFLAPALERDLLLCFFPDRDWRKSPRWPGFGRWRSLAICFEMLGQYEDALDAYRPADAALRGDALLAIGRLAPLLDTPRMPAPWQTLWQAYRCHALCLAGRLAEGVALARSLVPVDVYEWVHVFECLLRGDSLSSMDLVSVLFRAGNEHRWAELARRRMRADYLRRTGRGDGLDAEYRDLLGQYERASLSYERALTGLGLASWCAEREQIDEAKQVLTATRNVVRQAGLAGLEVDVSAHLARLNGAAESPELLHVREQIGLLAPPRP